MSIGPIPQNSYQTWPYSPVNPNFEPWITPTFPQNPDPYLDPNYNRPYYPYMPTYPNQHQQGCICPGDATPFCKNPMCPRKNPFDKAVATC